MREETRAMLTVTGNEDESVNAQSRHLDVERVDVVQDTFHPSNLVRCTILELSSLRRAGDLELCWERRIGLVSYRLCQMVGKCEWE